MNKGTGHNGVRNYQHSVRRAGGDKLPDTSHAQSQTTTQKETCVGMVWTPGLMEVTALGVHRARREACGLPGGSIFSESPNHLSLLTHIVS